MIILLYIFTLFNPAGESFLCQTVQNSLILLVLVCLVGKPGSINDLEKFSIFDPP